ncbi:MAG: hypothetical protein ABIK44_07090 [candidate division WOR-3 bacterium]
MKHFLISASITVFLIAAAGQTSAQDLSRLLRGIEVQKLPVVVGGRADIGYQLEEKEPYYGIAAELLFPVYGPIRTRAQLLSFTIHGGNEQVLSFNTGVGLDGIFSFASRRLRLWPYLFLGGWLTLQNQTPAYDLRLGAGLEGRLKQNLSAFGELLFDHSYAFVSEASANRLQVSAGVRFGR